MTYTDTIPRRIALTLALLSWPGLIAAFILVLTTGAAWLSALQMLLGVVATISTLGWLLMVTVPNLYDAWSRGVEYGQEHPPLKSERTEQTVKVGGNVLGFRRR